VTRCKEERGRTLMLTQNFEKGDRENVIEWSGHGEEGIVVLIVW
jgi:hypothetical protein